MNALKKIFFIVIFINFVNFSYAQDPSEFISDITNTASEILKENITTEAKADKLIIIAERSVDIDGIGLYSLGKHRKSINKDQLERYKKTFREYFLKSFSSRLSQYSDPKINVLSENVINEKYTIVSSILIETADRPEIKIDWRVYTKDPNNPLIRDLIIEGLSLARTQKEDFKSILSSNDGDINALFKTLEDFSKN